MYLFNGDYHDRSTKVDKLREVVELTAPKIKELMTTTPVTHLVATGMSGMAGAFSLSVATGLPVAVVRRNDEHGYHTEGNYGVVGSGELGDFFVIDDFISSGRTLNYLLARVNKAWEITNTGDPRPLCRGIFLYHAKPRDDREFVVNFDRAPSEFYSAFKYPFNIPVIGTRPEE